MSRWPHNIAHGRPIYYTAHEIFADLCKYDRKHAFKFFVDVMILRLDPSETRAILTARPSLWKGLSSTTITNSTLTNKQWVLLYSRVPKAKFNNETYDYVMQHLTLSILAGKEKKTHQLSKALRLVKGKHNVV